MVTRCNYCLVLLLTVTVTCSLSAAQKHSKSDIPCQIDSDCNVGSWRNADNTVNVICADDFCEFSVSEPEALTVVTMLGAQCRFNEECNINSAICDVDRTCSCTNGTVSSFNRKRCIEEAKKIGDACEEDIQCNFPQTTCVAKKCECEAGYVVDPETDTECKEINGIGFACEKNDDCEMEHTKCNANRTCDCIEGYSAHKKECYAMSVTYLSHCDIDYQCQKTLGADAICIRGGCHCQAKHIFSVLKNQCIKPTNRNVYNHGVTTFIGAYHLLPLLSTLIMLLNKNN